MLQSCRTTYCQISIMGIRTLGRRISFEPYGSDSDVLIIPHRIYRGLDFTQFMRIPTIFRINDRLVDREVNEGRTGERATLDSLCLRVDIKQLRRQRKYFHIAAQRLHTFCQ